MNALTTAPDIATTVDNVIAKGNLSELTPEQRVMHYHAVCKSLGLNPLTQPFMYVTLNGQLRLYAKRDACDQLRKIHGVNVEIVNHTVTDALLTVHVRATDKTGRTDEDFGVVSVAGLRGEAAANAFMKAITKAKRRVTLSITGLGLNDESELDEETNVPSFAPKLAPKVPDLPKMSQELLTKMAGEQIERAVATAKYPPPGKTYDEATREDLDRTSIDSSPPVEPCEIPLTGDDVEAWSGWAKMFMASIRSAPSADIINEWQMANADNLAAFQARSEKSYLKLVDQVKAQIEAMSEEGT